MSYKIESPLPVIEGGSGVRSTTAYAVICGGTTSTNPFQPIATVGTSGQILTSNGAGMLPTFQAAPSGGATNFDTDVGTATQSAGTINIKTNLATLDCGSSVLFTGTGDDVVLSVTDSLFNTIIGLDSGNLTLTGQYNTVVGNASGLSLTSGNFNTLIGAGVAPILTSALNNTFVGNGSGLLLTSGDSNSVFGSNAAVGLTTGTNNVVVGQNAAATMSTAFSNVILGDSSANAMTDAQHNVIIGGGAAGSLTSSGSNVIVGGTAASALSTGASNVIIGRAAANAMTTGASNVVIGQSAVSFIEDSSFNVIIGRNAGNAYTTSDGSNICIGYGALGVVGESNALRIGSATGTSSGQLNASFIQGIYGITPTTNNGVPVYISSDGQLGTVGSPNVPYTSVNTSPYVVLSTDNYISVDSSGGAITIQLPNAATLGKTYIVKDRAGSAATNNITITTVGGVVNIDGAATFVMNTAFESVDIIGNGSTYELY